jgi:NitT/TauT family transport system ATP-binding protein
MIESVQASLAYGASREALRDVSFQIEQGEFIAIVGPSGCGKTTLLRLLAGLVEPTSGAITISGVCPAEARRKKLCVSYVFQDALLLAWRTVLANVRLPLELRGVSAELQQQKASEALSQVRLFGADMLRPHQLSGGMQMRVSLARAIAIDPDLILMDEPFAALDVVARQALNEELLRTWTHIRKTIVIVTHDIMDALFLSQRVFVIGGSPGRLIAEHRVPFDYPRSWSVREDPRFLSVAREILDSLKRASV